MKTIKKVTKEKKPEKVEPANVLKLWGLHIPLDHPFSRKEVKLLFFAFLIFLVVLAALSKKELWWVAGRISGSKTVGWVKDLISQRQTRSP